MESYARRSRERDYSRKDTFAPEPAAFWGCVRASWPNWTTLGALIVVFLILELAGSPFEGTISPVGWDHIKYPYHKHSTVPGYWTPIYGFVAPVVFAVLYHILFHSDIQEFHDLLFSVLLNLAITGNITEALKLSIGRPRPNYYEHCYGHAFEENTEFDVYDPPDCTDVHKGVEDARKSFPSGHTSWAMSAFFYMTLFMIGKFHVFEKSTSGRGWKFILSVLPSCLGVWIGITRITDYKHHWTDVLCGGLLGSGSALAVYLMYYPWPFARRGTGVPLYTASHQDAPVGTEGERDSLDIALEEGLTPMTPIVPLNAHSFK